MYDSLLGAKHQDLFHKERRSLHNHIPGEFSSCDAEFFFLKKKEKRQKWKLLFPYFETFAFNW